MRRFLKALPLFFFITLGQLSAPLPAFALQAHNYVGLYVHQAAHLFFLLAFLSFTFRIHRFGLISQPEWRWISKGAWLLVLWNIYAFSGHIIELFIPADTILQFEGKAVPSLAISSWRERVYYLLKMDHLLSVPSIICFFMGLKIMLNNNKQPNPSQ